VRTPSLWDLVVTRSHFHDGNVHVLEGAVRKMDQAQLDRSPWDGHVNAIVVFMNTLPGVYRGGEFAAPL
jgi:cytochrome c peroxidase